MWAVGENRVAIMKFQISNFHCYGVRLLHTFFAQMGPGPLNFFQERGGGLFNIRGGGGFFRSNFNSKNHHFSDDFPVIFWYIHSMLLH